MQSPDVVRFGPFTADLHTQELHKAGHRIRMPGQSFQVLQALLRRPGELVTREELQQTLWPGESFGDFEHGINAAVNRVREALGDSAEHPRFIETLPRRGYRFVSPLEPNETATSPGSSQPSATHGETPSPSVPTPPAPASTGVPGARTHTATAAVALLLAIVATLVFYLRKHDVSIARNSPSADVTTTPLTSLPGSEFSPAFSPDGSQVVFAWDGGNSNPLERLDLYAKVVGSENVERLTHHPAAWLSPAWSPDGSTIAFTRETIDGTVTNVGVFLISARGGPERKLAGTSYSRSVMPASLTWSPDGRELIYTYDYGIHAITLDTGAIRDIDTSPCIQPFAPSLSPDGSTLAFICYVHDSWTDLYLAPRAGEKPKLLLRPLSTVAAIVWSNDSKRLIFPTDEGLSEISRDGGAPRRLPFGEGAFLPAIASHGNRLAYVKGSGTVNIWRVNLGKNGPGSRTVLAPTSNLQRQPSIAPDGQRIVFESDRSGFHEVWVSNLDGSDALQLTHLHTHSGTGSPKWSPDGQEILFDSRASGRPAIYMVDTITATPKIFPIADLDPSVPTWSRDGRSIYFHSNNVSKPGIYKVARAGGSPIRITASEGWNAVESSDGKSLYFAATKGELRVLSLLTGEEHPLSGMPRLQAPSEWVLTPTGIYFVNVNNSTPSIDFFDLSSGKVTRRIPLDKPPVFYGGLSLSPDGAWLAYSQVDQSASDLMLVEGFR